MKTAEKLQIRWMFKRDLAEVLEIEQGSFEHAWTRGEFITCLSKSNAIGMVAEHDHRIDGYMIYELNKTQLRILNFAVHPAYRRDGVGTADRQVVAATADADRHRSQGDEFTRSKVLRVVRLPRCLCGAWHLRRY